ncbi:MAG: DapH/DapD/GlmU-related protein [Oscillospiraceae bacterium]|jgi:acetyltransferase-like isoleucine patch superfamily enzyme|nr:DapH/DapD/GlmU-related protein [Oscillospiraceae bacterium]
MDIYERAKLGEPIDTVNSAEFKEILWPETMRSRILCQKINALQPDDVRVRELTEELLEEKLPKSSRITPPFQIDRGHPVSIGERVMINEGLDVMSLGGITIEDDVLFGPQVTILTSNHDFKKHEILINKPVRIKKRAWICAKAVICPGVTIGEGAVVAAGAVVTKDVAPDTLVGGNPAKFIKKI